MLYQFWALNTPPEDTPGVAIVLISTVLHVATILWAAVALDAVSGDPAARGLFNPDVLQGLLTIPALRLALALALCSAAIGALEGVTGAFLPPIRECLLDFGHDGYKEGLVIPVILFLVLWSLHSGVGIVVALSIFMVGLGFAVASVLVVFALPLTGGLVAGAWLGTRFFGDFKPKAAA